MKCIIEIDMDGPEFRDAPVFSLRCVIDSAKERLMQFYADDLPLSEPIRLHHAFTGRPTGELRITA